MSAAIPWKETCTAWDVEARLGNGVGGSFLAAPDKLTLSWRDDPLGVGAELVGSIRLSSAFMASVAVNGGGLA